MEAKQSTEDMDTETTAGACGGVCSSGKRGPVDPFALMMAKREKVDKRYLERPLAQTGLSGRVGSPNSAEPRPTVLRRAAPAVPVPARSKATRFRFPGGLGRSGSGRAALSHFSMGWRYVGRPLAPPFSMALETAPSTAHTAS